MNIDFNKDQQGLVPAIIQDADTAKVLMLGYMNREAFQKTIDTRRVTFYSRSRKRLWTKGEESGNYLNLVDLKEDCDQDTLLVQVRPEGPVCHTGTDTCWGERNKQEETSFISQLEQVITRRKEDPENQESYIASLFRGGINKIAQKVGEEAVEMVIESKDDQDPLFLEESADLLFHYLILLQARGFTLKDVTKVLEARSQG